jgi:hypothetical protein
MEDGGGDTSVVQELVMGLEEGGHSSKVCVCFFFIFHGQTMTCLIMVAGPDGNVQSELLFRKDPSTFTFQKGWAFPRRIYFNGDNCVMPPPDA